MWNHKPFKELVEALIEGGFGLKAKDFLAFGDGGVGDGNFARGVR